MKCRSLTLAVIALVLLAAAAYLPSLRGGFIWDDDDHLTNNPSVAAADGLRQIWSSLAVSRYYPLTLTTFWLERHLWGLNPLPYHAVNILLHTANAVLLYFLLRRLQVRAAWVAAALWAVHPVNVESVAWVTEMKNTQSALFFFGALLCYLRFEERPRPGWFTGALLCFAAALASKPSTVVLPGVLLLCIGWQRGRWTITDLLRTAPFAALAAAMSWLTIAEQQRHVQGAGTQEWSLNFAGRWIVASKALWFYTAKLLWPANLAFVYPRWEIHPESLTAWLPLAGLLAIAGTLWRLRHQPWARASLFGLAYFALSLAPVLGFFNVYYFRFSFVADHFNYLASAGVLALVAAGMHAALRQPFAGPAAATVLSVATLLTWQHAPVFWNEERLWRDTVAKNPNAMIAHNNLGTVLHGQGHDPQAIAEWQTALRLSPCAWEPQMNLGKTFLDRGNHAEAVACFQAALRARPGSVEAHYGLGMALTEMGRYAEACTQFEAALQITPEKGVVHFWLATIHERQGQLAEAVREYQCAIRQEPTLAGAYVNLGLLRQKQGERERAIQCFRTAIQLHPADRQAHDALAKLEVQSPLTESRP